MPYALLADFVVLVHLAYVAFVVPGQVAICTGAALRWGWVRNLWFRVAHLTAILIVALESLLGIVCPLTRWENHLRALAGETAGQESFVARWVHALMFYECSESVFTTIYVLFASAVAVTLWLVPPRWRGRAESG